jgi:hypothetical protein
MTELPVIMASLEIDDNQAPSVESEEKNRTETLCEVVCRALRKRVQGTCQPHESSKRRSCLRPRKLNTSHKIDDGESYFMSKKFRSLKVRTLATIYEEPKVKRNGTVVHMGPTKIRKINFNAISKDKIRKRKAKTKKVISNTNPKRGKLSMDEFLPRLQGLMGSSSNSNSDTNAMTSLETCDME